MLELISKIVSDVTGRHGITLDTDFVQDLELNSFDIINIVTAFEDHFDTTIPTRDIWQLHRVRDVLDYLAAHGYRDP